MIEIDHVTKRYGSTTAVQDVSFTAAPGRVTGFLGPNGAGKSTTLRILMGLDRATSGTALVNGVPYPRIDQPLRTVGSMLDGASALPERRGVDHLRWIAQSNAIPPSRVHEVLATVGLTHAARTRVKNYSLGMKQRLGLAAALLGEPEILVLDEPVNGLDPDGIRTVRQFLRSYADQGKTVLLSSHLMGEIAQTADDVVVINDGRIIGSGPIGEVIGSHDSLESAFFALTQNAPGSTW